MKTPDLHLQITPANMSHNIQVQDDPSLSLVSWACRYLEEEVVGIQSNHTFNAKLRDLRSFFEWFIELNGHLRIETWLPRDTKAYLDHLEGLGRAPSTVNRALATLRRFARWAHDQEGSPFVGGLPTRGVKALVIDQPVAKKLPQNDVYRLFKAADTLVVSETRKNSRPRRNRAILAALYFTGLRVSELCRLELEQYQGKHLLGVVRKGRTRSRIFLSAQCREELDDYLEKERPQDEGDESKALFLSTRGAKLTRRQVSRILDHIAEEASKHRDEAGKITVHPHQLRHTFGSWIQQKTGSDVKTAEFLGHSSTKYVGRYTRLTAEEEEELFEGMDVL